MDLIDQGIVILDSRGRIQDANKWFLDMTALVRTSVISRTVEDFIHDADFEVFQNTMNTCDVDQKKQVEVRWKCKSLPECKTTVTIAKMEGLDAHANSILVRARGEKK